MTERGPEPGPVPDVVKRGMPVWVLAYGGWQPGHIAYLNSSGKCMVEFTRIGRRYSTFGMRSVYPDQLRARTVDGGDDG